MRLLHELLGAPSDYPGRPRTRDHQLAPSQCMVCCLEDNYAIHTFSASGRRNLVLRPMILAMPPARSGGQQETQGPVAHLLMYTREILELESKLRIARILRRFVRASTFFIVAGIVGLYVFNVVEWHKITLWVINLPVVLIILGMIVSLIVYGSFRGDEKRSRSGNLSGTIYDVPGLELALELAQERRRLHAASLNLGTQTRQMIYRDSVPAGIDRYRGESKYYRRVHNGLQAIIIVGSLAASTLTGLLQSVPPLRWFAVGTTFSVGVAAGFTGYFKFRERSFYLQQTSDSIDQELSAVNLGIGRYKDKEEPVALTEFTEQVELLKVEQRKRQQQLEQPSEGRESVQ